MYGISGPENRQCQYYLQRCFYFVVGRLDFSLSYYVQRSTESKCPIVDKRRIIGDLIGIKRLEVEHLILIIVLLITCASVY